MHISLNVLGLEHLWVIYPGQHSAFSYAIQERTSIGSMQDLVDLGQLLEL